jgi:hypothetical protein
MRKYELPEFLVGVVTQVKYDRWLQRKATAHVRRDRKRGNLRAKIADYKIAIHNAVILSEGLDSYTNEKLDWTLLSKWNNEEAKDRGRDHKKEFYSLPSVDHVGDGRGKPEFKICGMLTNDVKSDLSHEQLLGLCERLLKAARRWPSSPTVLK